MNVTLLHFYRVLLGAGILSLTFVFPLVPTIYICVVQNFAFEISTSRFE